MTFDGKEVRCSSCGASEIEPMTDVYARLLDRRRDGSLVVPPVRLTLQAVRCRKCHDEWALIGSMEPRDWEKLPRWEKLLREQ